MTTLEEFLDDNYMETKIRLVPNDTEVGVIEIISIPGSEYRIVLKDNDDREVDTMYGLSLECIEDFGRQIIDYVKNMRKEFKEE